MIPTKVRESRRMKSLKLSKSLERKFREVNCRECTVVVTPMDFAKILGRFTKVKIQYESSSKSKPKQTNVVSPSSRLKAKENGVVHIHKNVYSQYQTPKLLGQKKSKSEALQTTNVLKENNVLKKPEKVIYSEYSNKHNKSKVKCYGVVFDDPRIRPLNIHSKISLQELLSDINENILPTEDWIIDYFPKNGEPKEDKIYDRIAAELEDLMYNEKTKNSNNDKDSKNDEYPSILDILNENTKDNTAKVNTASSVNLESSDVEAMLLGNTCTPVPTPTVPTPMEVDLNTETINKGEPHTIDDNPESPSILEEPFQKDTNVTEMTKVSNKDVKIGEPTQASTSQTSSIDENENTNTNNKNTISKSEVTQIIFKKSINGKCFKSVTCPKNLKYTISMLGKSVELLGAPQHVSSLEDLQVLLQIVEESDLSNLYVLQ